MALLNKILVSETQMEGRFDAEYFSPQYNHLVNLIHTIENKSKFSSLAAFIKKGIFDISPTKYRDTGVPLIRTTQIKTPVTNEDNLIFIQEDEHIKNHFKTELLPTDIVFTKIGAGIGDVAILSNKFPKYNFSQNVAGASIIKEKIEPYYLIAVLISSFGKEQILRYMMPSGQGKLELKDIKKIIIPRLADKEDMIAELVRNSERSIFQSKFLYQQAEVILNEALGINRVDFKKDKTYRTSFNEVVHSSRVDADFYQTKYKQLADFLDTVETRKLSTIAKFQKGIEVGTASYMDSGPLFIRVSNLSKDGFSQGNSDKYISAETYSKLKMHQPEIGDVLLTKDGTIGTCYVVDEELEGIISSGILKLYNIDPEIPKEYLALVINSISCSMQAKRDCSGALILHWKPEDIRKMKIPILPKEIRNHLAELVVKSKEARRESKRLLAQAITEVETLIEQASNN